LFLGLSIVSSYRTRDKDEKPARSKQRVIEIDHSHTRFYRCYSIMLNRCFGTRDEQRRDFLTLDRADDAARVKQEAIIAIGISQDC
jgi:hypothetical protein